MDILLINPPYERLMGLKVSTFPIGLGSIGTVLKKNNYDVSIYNCELGLDKNKFSYTASGRIDASGDFKKNLYNDDHEVWHEIRAVIKKYQPKIIGLTSYLSTNTCVIKIAKIAKEIYDPIIVVGGPYPTLLPEENIKNEIYDYVAFGEAEYTMLELTDYLLRKKGGISEIKGICYRENGKIIKNPPRERIADLDALPFIDYSLLIKDSASGVKWNQIVASRGCPFRCTFCASVPLWGRRVVIRSAKSLIEEISLNYGKYGGAGFRFLDDTFTANIKNTIEFCNLFVEKGLHKKLSWGCLSRINVISEELLENLEKANCRQIALGVESGSERILKTFKKDITKDMVREKVKLIKKTKIRAHLYFIIGSPYEEEKDILETRDFIKELKPDSINLCTFTPYYGTELYDTCVKWGLMPKEHDVKIYEDIGHHNKYNYFCPKIPRERYIELVDMMSELADWVCQRITLQKILREFKKLHKQPVIVAKKGINKFFRLYK